MNRSTTLALGVSLVMLGACSSDNTFNAPPQATPTPAPTASPTPAPTASPTPSPTPVASAFETLAAKNADDEPTNPDAALVDDINAIFGPADARPVEVNPGDSVQDVIDRARQP